MSFTILANENTETLKKRKEQFCTLFPRCTGTAGGLRSPIRALLLAPLKGVLSIPSLILECYQFAWF